MRKLVVGGLVAILPVLAACTSKSPSPTLTSIIVSGLAALQSRNQTTQLTATANLSNSTTQDVTATSTWSSSNGGILTVSSTGLVTAVTNGTATITAVYQGALGPFTIVVTLQAEPQVGVVWRRLCSPFRFQLNITISEISGNAGMNITSMTGTMKLFGVVMNTKVFSVADLTSFLGGSNHFNAGQAKIIVYEGTYAGNVDTEDSQATVDASFTDDFGNVRNLTVNSVGRQDGC